MNDDDYDDDMPSIPTAPTDSGEAETGTDADETETGVVSVTDAAPPVADDPEAQPAAIVPATVSPKQEALRGLPPEWRERLIEQASAMGIRADEDTAWLLVKSFINAWAGAAAATTAAERIEAATRGVGDQIYQTTVRAAADLKGVINADIRQNAADVGRATANAILVSINKGTEKIQEVVADLDKIAQEKGAQFAASWRAQAARAGEEQAKAALQKAIAIRWGVVTMTITISIVAGALIATGFADWTGHLLPWKWALITNPQGLSECGLTRGYPHNPMCWVRNY